MAKRKKLNKRVVMLLVAFGVVVAAGVVVLGLRMLPKNPEASARAGDKLFEEGKAALEKGDFKLAVQRFESAGKKYQEAINGDKVNPDYPYKMAELQWQWSVVPSISEAMRGAHAKVAYDRVAEALSREPEHVPSLRLNCEISWRREGADKFIQEASRLLSRADDDCETYHRRALAKISLIPGNSRYIDDAYADLRKAIQLKPDNPEYWRSLLVLFARYMPDKLEETYKQAIESNPNTPSLRVDYGEYLLDKSWAIRREKPTLSPAEEAEAAKWEKQAEEEFTKAKESEPENTSPRIAMGRLCLLKGDLQKARITLEDAVRIDEGACDAYRLLADVYARQGERDKSIGSARKALSTMPQIPEESVTDPRDKDRRRVLLDYRKRLNDQIASALTDKAFAATGTEKKNLLADAQSCLSEIDKIDPKYPGKAYAAARIALAEGKEEEAVSVLERATSDKTADGRAIDLLLRLYLEPYPGKAEKLAASLADDTYGLVYKALVKMRFQRYAEAAELMKRIPAADKANPEIKNLELVLSYLTGQVPRLPAEIKLSDGPLIRALLREADRLWAAGRKPGAVTLLEDLHAKLPDEKSIVANLVNVYRQQNQTAKIDELLNRVKAAHKGDASWQQFTDVLSTTDPQQLFAMQMEQAKSNSDDFAREMAMANLCLRYGKEEEFSKHLQEAAKLKSDDPQVVEWRLDAAIAKRDLKTAEECVELAAKADLDRVGGRFYKTKLLMATGRPSEAAALLQEILTYRSSKRVRLLLGECHLAAGELDMAKEVIERLTRDDPSDPQAAIVMALIMGEKLSRQELADWSRQPHRLAPAESSTSWEAKRIEQDFRKWLERAGELAPNDPRVDEWKAELEERQAIARGDKLGRFISRREQRLAAVGGDLRNILKLALLYEKSKQPQKAEACYRSYFEKSGDKVGAADVLGGFYLRSNRRADVDKLMQDLLKQATNNSVKSAVYVVYGSLLSFSNPQEALNVYDKAIETDANNVRAYRAKAALLDNQGRKQEAADVLGAYVKRKPDDLATRKDLARYYMTLGQADAAARELDAVIEAGKRQDKEALALRGTAALEQNNRAKALEFLDAALKIDPDYLEARTQVARAYFLERQDKQASDTLKKAEAAASASDPVRMTLLGNAWLSMTEPVEGRPDKPDEACLEARRAFRLARAADPDYEPAVRGFLRTYVAEKSWSIVLQEIEKARRAFPDEPFYLRLKADVHKENNQSREEIAALAELFKMLQGSPEILSGYLDALMRAGLFEEALAVSKEYVNKPGYEVMAPAMHGRALAKLNRPNEADPLFISALKGADERQLAFVVVQIRGGYGPEQCAGKLADWLKHRPKDATLLMLLGMLREELKDTAGAIKVFEEARDVADKDHPDIKAMAWSRIGKVYQDIRETAKSENAYKKALELQPDVVFTLNNLAYLYVDQFKQSTDVLPGKALPDKQYAEKARLHAERAVKMAPRSGSVLDTYGWTLVGLGRYKEAIDMINAAKDLKVPVGRGLVYYHLGWAYERMGELDKAIEHFGHAREFAVNDPELSRQISEALEYANARRLGRRK